MEYMFFGCQKLKVLNVSRFDTFQVVSMKYMFAECHNLISLDISNFDLSQKNLKTFFG
jgi:surface protein